MRNTLDDEHDPEYHRILTKVIDREPKLFAKWFAMQEKFSILGWADSPIKPFWGVKDALKMINKADFK
jgi:hypothetical protein